MRKKFDNITGLGGHAPLAVCPCSGHPVIDFDVLSMNGLHIFNADPCLSIDRMNKN